MISDDLYDLYTERRSDRIGSLSREVPTAGSPLGGRVGSGFPQPAVPYGAKLAVASLSKADKYDLYDLYEDLNDPYDLYDLSEDLYDLRRSL